MELKFIALKTILLSKELEYIKKKKLYQYVYSCDKNNFFNKVRNVCVLTGRRNGVYRLFRISRIQLRREASTGGIYGLAKSSW